MPPVTFRVAVSVVSLALAAVQWSNRFDRRVVDTVIAGDAVSEANHGYVGAEVTTGNADGKPFRQTRGYMRYAMTTFDDTPVTVACTFAGTKNVAHNFDVVVEDSVIATRTLTTSDSASVVEIAVPFVLTKGKTNIAIIIRARDGLTPALRMLRTVQDHNEFQ
jgi:hypothetical protein